MGCAVLCFLWALSTPVERSIVVRTGIRQPVNRLLGGSSRAAEKAEAQQKDTQLGCLHNRTPGLLFLLDKLHGFQNTLEGPKVVLSASGFSWVELDPKIRVGR